MAKRELNEIEKEQRRRDREKDLTFWGICILYVLGFCLCVAAVVVEIYVWVKYGGKPVSDIPMWALWFMFGGK